MKSLYKKHAETVNLDAMGKNEQSDRFESEDPVSCNQYTFA